MTRDEQFLAYHDKLRDELNRAFVYYQMSKVFRDVPRLHHEEYIEAVTFFGFSTNAYLIATMISLSRFIDTHRNALHLELFFKFVGDNIDLFSTEVYKKRLRASGRDREDCEHFAKSHVPITAEIVQKDQELLAKIPLKNIKIWRDKRLAHIEEDYVVNKIDVYKENPLTVQEIDSIISTLDEILNRYYQSFNGTDWIMDTLPAKLQAEYIVGAVKALREARIQSRRRPTPPL